MANTLIDVAAKTAIDSITDSAAGSVTNDVAVVLKQGISVENAVVTLTNIIAYIVSGRSSLE